MSFFDQFIKEKEMLLGVSPATVSWYASALKKLPCPAPTQDQLKQIVMHMRMSGMKPTGCNAASRAINSYLSWLGSEHRAPLLKEPKLALPSFTGDQIKLLITSSYDPQLKSLICLLLDTGSRISEALSLQPSDIGDGVLTLHGKGAKDRVVPFSTGYEILCPFPWKRNWVLRLVKRQCRALGFEPPRRTLHAFRHTFATEYIRRNGSILFLSRVLGHTTVTMSQRYVHVVAADLIAAHRSPLTASLDRCGILRLDPPLPTLPTLPSFTYMPTRDDSA